MTWDGVLPSWDIILLEQYWWRQIMKRCGSHYIFSHGQKDIDLIGAVPEIEAETVSLQQQFWQSR